ncbi:MAG: hypothetical protein HC846_11015 [Blastocatellia bacterium]|nr:hypothetical protein [Blastocatellia bacterium]
MANRKLDLLNFFSFWHSLFGNPARNFTMMFHGEPHNFRTQSDTEVLLAAYQKWGENCLDRLIGMFAFIIWDEIEKKAFAARDRFGVKPLYYHQKIDGTLLISSEIKALHAARVPRIPNEKNLGDVFNLRFVRPFTGIFLGRNSQSSGGA